MRSWLVTALAALSVGGLLGGGQAFAAPVQIVFTLEGSDALPESRLFYPGGPAPLIGSAILVTTVTGVNTPTNADTFAVLSGLLNFVTGGALGTSGGTTTFAPGGSLRLTGTIDANHDGTFDAGEPSGLLVSSSFGSSQAIRHDDERTTLELGLVADLKSPAMLAFFGINTMTEFKGTMLLNFDRVDLRGGGFESEGDDIGDGTLTNVAVPEPTTLMLLGAGMVIVGVVARRRRRNP